MFEITGGFWSLVLQIIVWICIAKIFTKLIFAYIEYKLGVEKRIVDHLNKITHQVEVEQHDGVWYWYDLHTEQFIAQGRTRDEIITVLKSQWIDHIFLVSDTELLVGPEFSPINPNVEN